MLSARSTCRSSAWSNQGRGGKLRKRYTATAEFLETLVAATIEPDDRPLGSILAMGDPMVANYGAGGLARLLPNQWDMCGRLRTIPDSVEEFTGFYKGMDPLGGDFLGYGRANLSKPAGRARVRTVRLPSWYRHGYIPDTKHLLRSEAIKDWINAYDPARPPSSIPKFDADSRYILWAADVWHSIKKHWVLELQRLSATRRAGQVGPAASSPP